MRGDAPIDNNLSYIGTISDTRPTSSSRGLIRIKAGNISTFFRSGALEIRPGRFPELDGLRGLFALGVLLVHLRMQSMYWSVIFMDGFFTLSSFLITRSLLETKAENNRQLLAGFYIRRFARIFPAYYGLLFCIAVLMLLINQVSDQLGLKAYTLSELIPYTLYVQYTQLFWQHDEINSFANSNRFLLHTWSLAIEEQFYLIWGALFCIARSIRIKAILAGLFIIIGIGSRISGWVDSPLITYRLDTFGYGIAFALLYHYATQISNPALLKRWSRIIGIATLASFAAFWTVTGSFTALWDYWAYGTPIELFQWSPASVLSSFGCGGVVFVLACRRNAAWLALFRSRAALYLGSISYCLYLVHYPIIDILLQLRTPIMQFGYWTNVAAVLVLTIGIAHFATQFFNWLHHKILVRTGLRKTATTELLSRHQDIESYVRQ
jgi:peptidoglycan/LPS O-acetylase OafA/YrhL